MRKENNGALAVLIQTCFWGFVLGFLAAGPLAQAASEHEYVGAAKCAICHKSPAQGEQYRIWQESAHAKAFATLGTPEAKEVAAKMGVSDPETSGKCLKCHATAYGLTEARVTQVIPVQEGVSCESCHGAGKDYMKMTVMKDKAAAIAAGMLIPDEATCLQCHNADSPTFKPFNYAERSEKIKHPVPEK